MQRINNEIISINDIIVLSEYNDIKVDKQHTISDITDNTITTTTNLTLNELNKIFEVGIV